MDMRSPSADDEVLREYLADNVRAWHESGARAVDITRAPSDESTFYSIDLVVVRLESGHDLKLVRKDFGSENSTGRPWSKSQKQLRRERELRVYRDLLAQVQLGTARYYGSVWDESQGRYWLFLEYVEGTYVRYSPFESWVAAAGWLGKLHASFSNRVGGHEAAGFLDQHNAAYFRSTSERALLAVSQVSVDLGKRLKHIVRGYDGVIDQMASQTRTLVHSAFRPDQILVDSQCYPVRICPLDWELAAVGSGLYDLATLIDGFEGSQRDEMLDTYGREAAIGGLNVADPAVAVHMIDCYRLHRRLNWLSKCIERHYAEDTVRRLIQDATDLADRLL